MHKVSQWNWSVWARFIISSFSRLRYEHHFCPQPYFWHIAHLCQQGIPEAQIKEREKQQEVLAAEFSALRNPKTRRNRRAQYERESKERGLLQSNAFAVQFAVVEDENEDLDKKRPDDSWGQVPTETMKMRMKI